VVQLLTHVTQGFGNEKRIYHQQTAGPAYAREHTKNPLARGRSRIKLEFLSLFQNPMVRTYGPIPQALGKSGLKPAFSLKSKVTVPKLKFWNSLF
jgi:hypothetical protein